MASGPSREKTLERNSTEGKENLKRKESAAPHVSVNWILVHAFSIVAASSYSNIPRPYENRGTNGNTRRRSSYCLTICAISSTITNQATYTLRLYKKDARVTTVVDYERRRTPQIMIETFFSDLYSFEVCHLRCACKLMVGKVVKKTQLLC